MKVNSFFTVSPTVSLDIFFVVTGFLIFGFFLLLVFLFFGIAGGIGVGIRVGIGVGIWGGGIGIGVTYGSILWSCENKPRNEKVNTPQALTKQSHRWPLLANLCSCKNSHFQLMKSLLVNLSEMFL